MSVMTLYLPKARVAAYKRGGVDALLSCAGSCDDVPSCRNCVLSRKHHKANGTHIRNQSLASIAGRFEIKIAK